jgi:flagellar biosynthesis protein FlhB
MNLFSRKCSNKKGNIVVEVMTVLVVLTILAIVGVYGYKLYDELNTDVQADPDMDATAKAKSGNLFTIYPDLIDNLFLFVFVLISLFVIISSFIIDTHPVFFIIAIVLFIAALVVSIFIGNAYDDLMHDTALATYANNLTYISWIMRHILELVLAVGFAVALALFAKYRA